MFHIRLLTSVQQYVLHLETRFNSELFYFTQTYILLLAVLNWKTEELFIGNNTERIRER